MIIDKTPSLSSISARLRFKQLVFLVALDEVGSLHQVAEQLAMTQPGATKMLHEIETTFGARLFERSKRGVQANDLGRCVLRYARLLQSDLTHLREEFTGVLTGKGGRLRVGAIGGALPAVVVPALTLLRESQPALSVNLREDTSAGLLAALDEGRLDLAICRTTVAPQPERYIYEMLRDEQVAVAVGPRHPLAHVENVSLAQLAGLNWILYPSLMPLRTLLEREFREAGLPLPEYTTETSSIFVTMLLLQEPYHPVALLTAENMELCVRHGLGRRLPLDIRARTESYGIVTRRDGVLSPAANLMAAALRQVAQA
ncbi:LysR family transcriptional regulator [Comamonadaceae bacterium G21597-S1]|nr:LysR family transcriptional regulator [Comamonadaceae bacterium G21597-S1]